MNDKPKSRRGGPRPGAGRKVPPGLRAKQKYQTRLRPWIIDRLRKEKNAAKTIEQALVKYFLEERNKMKPSIELMERVVSGLRSNIPQAIVKTESGFDDIPQTYLTDISYQGSREVVALYNDISDVCPDAETEALPDRNIAEMLLVLGEW